MFDGIEMNVIHVPVQVALVTDHVLPESLMPYTARFLMDLTRGRLKFVGA